MSQTRGAASRVNRRPGECEYPACRREADVEVDWILPPGRRFHFRPGNAIAAFGEHDKAHLCAIHAAEVVAGTDPPRSSRDLNARRPKRSKDETPRFAEDFGL